jgi:TniQ
MLREWPICPSPEPDESLVSWIERIGREYGMSPTALLNSIEAQNGTPIDGQTRLDRNRLYEPQFVDRLMALSQLPPSARDTLWPPTTGWELQDPAFRVYCPTCCLWDIRGGRTPYGRQRWQQSWSTICLEHGCPLVMRKPHSACGFDIPWSAAQLRSEIHYCTPDRYRGLKVARESEVRLTILGSLVEIQRVVAKALAGISPNPLFWGNLTAQEFLAVLDDVTTWSLTHFEPVSAWSAAEELTAVEEQEGYGLVGRLRRQCGSAGKANPNQNGQRNLREVTHPKVRGAALWVAHMLLSICHRDASDRPTGDTSQQRQAARLRGAAPAGREWLANRQQRWPVAYRRQCWIDLTQTQPTPTAPHNVCCDIDS